MEKYRETIRRAARTFIQTAVGYLLANVAALVPVWTAGEDADYFLRCVIGVLASAIAAGLAAVMNLPTKETEKEEAEG